MKAVGYQKPGPIEAPKSLINFEMNEPVVTGRDLLVEVKAVSVNPVDTKVRSGTLPPDGQMKVLGWDAAGVVKAVGSEVTLFQPGDEVYYAGSIARNGTNSELHLVDERIVGRKPQSLDFVQSAALPLTTLTAWELLFDRFQLPLHGGEGSLLITGAAGGVGSILIQLARKLTRLNIVATASRAETKEWCLSLGAHQVIDHSKDLIAQMKEIGSPEIRYIASLNATDTHYSTLVELLAPQGRIGVVDDPKSVDVTALKRKAGALCWEFMFARSLFETPDMIRQHEILNDVAKLIDEGTLRTTSAHSFGRIDAENLKRAHALIESGRSHGKIVLSGF